MRDWARPYGVVALTGWFVVGAVLGAVSMLSAGEPGFIDLRDLVFAARLVLPYASVPVGWLMVWAMAVHRPDSLLVGPAPGRSRSRIIARQTGLGAAALAVGFLIALAPLAVILASTQHWTPADPVSLLTVAVALASLVPVAACGALLVGPRLGLLVAPLTVLALVLLPTYLIDVPLLGDTGASLESVTYIWDHSYPGRGEMLIWQLEAFRMGFFGLVGVAAWRAATGLGEWRAAADRRALASLAVLTVPTAIAVAASLLNPPLTAPDPADRVRCADDHGLTLCLYAVDEPNRELTARTLAPFAAVLPPEQLVFTQDLDAPGMSTGRIGGEPADRLELEVRSIALGLVTVTTVPEPPACHEPPPGTEGLQQAVARQLLLRQGRDAAQPDVRALWLGLPEAQESHNAELDARLDHLSDGEFRTWFSAHQAVLRDCTLTAGQLP